jgi:amino acid adenylation domain-containing protein
LNMAAGKIDKEVQDVTQSLESTREYTLSLYQSRIWFLSNYYAGMIAFNFPLAYSFNGSLNVEVLERTLNYLVSRYKSLRTVFLKVDDEPVQKILPEQHFSLPIVHLEHEPSERIESLIREYSLENAWFNFNLETGPLYRFHLLVTGKDKYIFLLNVHRIVLDAMSYCKFLDEFGKVYNSYLENQSPDLPKPDVSYSDYIQLQQQWVKSDNYERQIEFWKKELKGVPDILQLPMDFKRPDAATYNGTEYHFLLESNLLGKLEQLSKTSGVSLSVQLLTAFAVLLNKYSVQEDFVLGFPVDNCTKPESESHTGLFTNTIPVRFVFPEEISFSELANQTAIRFHAAFENHETPVEHIIDELKVKRSMNNNPLFQVFFNYLTGNTDEVELHRSKLQLMESEKVAVRYDLGLTIHNRTHGMECVIEYNTDLFRDETISRMSGHYLRILESIVKNPSISIHGIPLLTNAESKLMLEDWNNVHTDYPEGKCIHDLFEEQVEKTPDSIAVVFEKEELTYRELNIRANCLANYLVKNGSKEGERIAICISRGLDLITSLLAVSKSGATYVPLDPIYPKARIALILEDASPLIMLSESSMLDNLPETSAQVVLLDKGSGYSGESGENLSFGNPGNIAYILYTSGSTGKPKGVQITQSAVVNTVTSMSRSLEFVSDDVLLAGTTISFDIAELEMYMPLFYGAKLVIATSETSVNVDLLKIKLEESAATFYQATPTSFRMLMLSEWKGKKDLKVLSGGEALTKELAGSLLSCCKAVWNGYGPTETAIYSTVRKITKEDCIGDGYVPIGRPIANTKVYVLNDRLLPVPIGIKGELYIGGIGVSPGYLNLPGMTNERFIPDPFDQKDHSRMYKTGDFVYYFPDGNLVFQNRADTQVKIRGFRIETGEIESLISTFGGIKENVVIAREDSQGEKILVAYCVPANEAIYDEAELRQFLKQKLPEYMIPSAIVSMEKLPMTANKKIDRKALPDPENFSFTSSIAYVEPQTPTEKRLTPIWMSVLKMEKIGIKDDFFEIGGQSMIALNLIVKIEKEFGIRLPLATLFDQRTIQKLAKEIEQRKESELMNGIENENVSGTTKNGRTINTNETDHQKHLLHRMKNRLNRYFRKDSSRQTPHQQ